YNESDTRNADPEATLLQTLKDFKDRRKMLRLVLAWLAEFGDLVHVERIKPLARDLSTIELAWLGGLSSAQVENGDLRWKMILRYVESKLGNPSPHFELSDFDNLQTQRR